jgi:S1-C subfamily serine protease
MRPSEIKTRRGARDREEAPTVEQAQAPNGVIRPMPVVPDCESGAASAVLSRTGPLVVAVNGSDLGSGFVIAPGYVLTSSSVAAYSSVSVRFGDLRSARATLVGIDADVGMALLAVDTGVAKPIDWDNPGRAAAGDGVLSGTVSRDAKVSFTLGAVTRVYEPFRGPGGLWVLGSIHHSAPLDGHSLGGPLIDLSGRFLGLNVRREANGVMIAVAAGPALRQHVDALL